jgi:hypothetical protein
MKHVIRIPAADQYVKVDPATGRASFTRFLGEATRFDDKAASAKVRGALPHSLGARMLEVKK